MKKGALILISSLIGQCIANSSICPTCPKDIVMSKVEEAYIAQNKEKGRIGQSKFKGQLNAIDLTKMTRSQNTPVQIVARRAEKLKPSGSHKNPPPGDSGWAKRSTKQVHDFLEARQHVHKYKK